MPRRIRVKPTKTVTVGPAVLTNENELVISDADFSGLSAAQLANLMDLGPANIATSTAQPSSTIKKIVENFDLGLKSGNAANFIYTEIPNVCHRGLMSRLIIESNAEALYDVAVLNSQTGSPEQFVLAQNVSNKYDISLPVYIEGDENGSIWIGVKNKFFAARSFTLKTLRVEKFA